MLPLVLTKRLIFSFQCSQDDCVRYQYSIQRREVDCVNEFNDSITDASFCAGLGFPPDNVRDCYSPNCTFKWITSKWSKVKLVFLNV